MFKKYRMEYDTKDGDKTSVDFFVNSKGARNGFMHRACVIGHLPRLDDSDTNWNEYRANDEKLWSKRMCKVTYCNRTWESWSGQTCLSKLWNNLAKLKFLDMSRIAPSDPFNGNEPDHEDLRDPEELFATFSRDVRWK